MLDVRARVCRDLARRSAVCFCRSPMPQGERDRFGRRSTYEQGGVARRASRTDGRSRGVSRTGTRARTFVGPAQASWLLVLDAARTRSGRCWVQLRVPWRPNDASGWVDASQVILRPNAWRIVVSTADRSLSVYRRGRLVRRVPVVVGKPSTPTPEGLFSIIGAWPSPPNAFLGSWILPLTAHSDVLGNSTGATAPSVSMGAAARACSIRSGRRVAMGASGSITRRSTGLSVRSAWKRYPEFPCGWSDLAAASGSRCRTAVRCGATRVSPECSGTIAAACRAIGSSRVTARRAKSSRGGGRCGPFQPRYLFCPAA